MSERIQEGHEGGRRTWLFICPGCRGVYKELGWPFLGAHRVDDSWGLSGTLEKPTIQSSILVNKGERRPLPRCHSFVTDGMIRYLSDSEHALAGQTVQLPTWDEVTK